MSDDTLIDDEQQDRERRADMRERVARGIAALDAQYPDWESHIDPAFLDLAASDTCIVGQVSMWKYGRDWGGQLLLPDDPDDVTVQSQSVQWRYFPPDLGMELSMDDRNSGYSIPHLYGMLTEVWLQALTIRAITTSNALLYERLSALAYRDAPTLPAWAHGTLEDLEHGDSTVDPA